MVDEKLQSRSVPPRPPFWLRLSEYWGNILQIAWIIGGASLLYTAAHFQGSAILRVLLMLLGWLLIYICSHAFAHWLVGRLVGIRFRGYGIRGSDHPYDYPPIFGLRHWMQFFPTFTAMTQKDSMQTVPPVARALMFAAGETSTTVCSILVGWYASAQGIPGGSAFLVVMIVFGLTVTVVTTITPRGDYAKALHTLHESKV